MFFCSHRYTDDNSRQIFLHFVEKAGKFYASQNLNVVFSNTLTRYSFYFLRWHVKVFSVYNAYIQHIVQNEYLKFA